MSIKKNKLRNRFKKPVSAAFEKINSGATLLQLYTSLVYEGPNVAKKINKELSELVKINGFKNVSDAIGIYCK